MGILNELTLSEAETWAMCGMTLIINDGKVVGIEED